MLCKQIIIITGPTATGKTGIGIKVAQKLGNAEIVSVDSRQIYRYMNIGTAKPNRDELESIRHHFIDVKDPDECYSAGSFGHEGRALIAELWEKKIIPVLVGGSGMYLQAIVDGLFVDGNDYSDTRQVLRQRLEEEGLEALFEELGRLDPQAQARLGANDAQRIMRALEVAYGGMEITGKRRERDRMRTMKYALLLMVDLLSWGTKGTGEPLLTPRFRGVVLIRARTSSRCRTLQ